MIYYNVMIDRGLDQNEACNWNIGKNGDMANRKVAILGFRAAGEI